MEVILPDVERSTVSGAYPITSIFSMFNYKFSETLNGFMRFVFHSIIVSNDIELIFQLSYPPPKECTVLLSGAFFTFYDESNTILDQNSIINYIKENLIMSCWWDVIRSNICNNLIHFNPNNIFSVDEMANLPYITSNVMYPTDVAGNVYEYFNAINSDNNLVLSINMLYNGYPLDDEHFSKYIDSITVRIKYSACGFSDKYKTISVWEMERLLTNYIMQKVHINQYDSILLNTIFSIFKSNSRKRLMLSITEI